MSPLEEIYGIGEIRASQLRERGFESVRDVAMASLADLTVLDGVGDSRARTIRDDARELLDEDTLEACGRKPSRVASENDPISCNETALCDADEYVTVCDVAADDVVVVAPGNALATAVGSTDYPELLDAAVVSLPRSGVLKLLGPRDGPDAEFANLTLETAVIWFSPGKLADVAPDLYEQLADRKNVAVSGAFPNAAFLSPTVCAVSGATILDVREQHPQLEDDVLTLLTSGTVLIDGSAFDFDNPHEVAVLESAGVYVRGDRALPDGVVFPADTVVPAACSLPTTASFLRPDVVSIPGNAATERGCTTPGRPSLTVARASPTVDGLSSTQSLLAQSGILLPPGAVQPKKR